MGNAVTVNVIAAIANKLLSSEDGVMVAHKPHKLEASRFDSSSSDSVRGLNETP